MSFATKTDYLGLADDDVLKIKGNGDGATNGNLEIPGRTGDIIANEVYGHVKAPTCDYVVTGASSSFSFELGKCHNSSNNYALRSYTVSTGAGQEPTVSAQGVQIEANSSKSAYCTYTPSEINLSPARHAMDFGCVSTWTESASLALQTGVYTAECTLDPSTINGEPVASDAVMGKETVVLTFWTNSDTTAPSITAATGWTQVADWACTGADSSMFVWTATFQKNLVGEEAA